MLTAAYYTLGCKVNQYETEQIRTALEKAGFRTVPFTSKADVYVINTCTVTAAADAKSRAAVRKAHRINPQACVVVTGCYAETSRDAVSRIEGVGLVVGNRDKDVLADKIISYIRAREQGLGSIDDALGGESASDNPPRAVLPRTRTRALVKVQDGCDHFCSYCIVPFARPEMHSRPIGEVLEEIRRLADYGYKEIVLTGIRLGSYRDSDQGLPDLVLQAAEISGIERIRLSSIEPWEIDEALIGVFQHPKVCRHLHIPLQSGDDEILARMNRPYRADDYLSLVNKIRDETPGIGITTDVIVGFPGETEEAFENTCEVVRRAGFSRLHVFRYSPRHLTRAAEMPNQVPEALKKERAEILSTIGLECARAFAQSWIGQTLPVLAEHRVRGSRLPTADNISAKTDLVLLRGFTDNYIEVTFPGELSLAGSVAGVTITGVDENGRAVGRAEEHSGEQMLCSSSGRLPSAKDDTAAENCRKGG
ncbi:MAG: tRNA (N(6)-L-threonylcarbamoyladenosine(37)-C(2))-methylthiotransferase MtaB [Armatimonadota bacterium]|nr:tRNA (N(6)-L-threonylcarbamoyladenosine(37)-C(2))-methylthiotransferase MtaB [Armatimonadota bacterium]